MNWKKKITLGAATLIALVSLSTPVLADENAKQTEDASTKFLTLSKEPILSIPEEFPSQFKYDSGVDIAYPEDGVKGIFVTGYSAGGSKLDSLVKMVNETELNSMVVDVKDDHGNMMMPLGSDNELINSSTQDVVDPEKFMNTMQENDIYPIARIVVFKDTKLATDRPDLSFTKDGEVWKNGRKESFVNPYEKEVWDYNVEVARQAAKLGFKDIQFDYVRFPEGFENRDEELNYSRGEYADSDLNNTKQRVEAVTDFVAYAKQELQAYDVDVSVDIFGYAATLEETPGIGQNFSRISENVDVISSMIYPSHWGVGSLGIDRPDLEPYSVVDKYMEHENTIFEQLGEKAPVSRPWLQDFTASYLGSGYYKQYGAEEVQEQIRALNEHGVNEFLLWNAGNVYSEGAQYSFD
ncbi:putative glycoside hydrolase [Marinilactibacillus psychrotolerans]|uniref:Glycoside hydrolase n=2 Tax=Marinilactibacillus psychrotolerans TaxID=191770 RepID=A0ABW8UFJ7_9LACT|nr:putative glycoside hydrolase [Marinilactibacillus psychrotolerans]GEQ32602.1 putative exported protein [Marinilactibacillus psychrotolerans]SJN42020.1 COG1306 predicted glycoside hydrolase [Marinilactibacillus psychrotolerans 42ea]